MGDAARTTRTNGLDDLDIRIIRELQSSGRMTNALLAERIGISPPSTLERVKRLEQAGVIKGYCALIEPSAVNQHVLAIVQVGLGSHSQTALESAKRALGAFEQVQACWHVAGDQDFILKVIVPDIPSYERFVSTQLSTVPGLARLKTSIVLSVSKDSTHVPLNAVGNGNRRGTKSSARQRRSGRSRSRRQAMANAEARAVVPAHTGTQCARPHPSYPLDARLRGRADT